MLEAGFTYHIFNRANGNEKIFVNKGNYYFFLERYRHYIAPFTNTFCYCLMPNHFHILLRVKEEKEIVASAARNENLQGFTGQGEGANLEGLAAGKIITNQFSKFFNSYAKAFNKQQNRRGILFMKNFKKKPVTNEKYLIKLVHYIHHNPVEAGLCKNPEEWNFSSYRELISEKPSMLEKDEIIGWFDDRENFIYCHKHPPEETGVEI